MRHLLIYLNSYFFNLLQNSRRTSPILDIDLAIFVKPLSDEPMAWRNAAAPCFERGYQGDNNWHRERLELRFVRDWNIPFTNNLAERDLRMMKLCMKIFGCFRTEEGARDFVARYSVISTAKKRGWEIIQTLALSAKELAVKLQAA